MQLQILSPYADPQNRMLPPANVILQYRPELQRDWTRSEICKTASDCAQLRYGGYELDIAYATSMFDAPESYATALTPSSG
jgi:hypothetical protein